MSSSNTTARAFDLELLSKVNDQDIGRRIGNRKAKHYKKLMARAGAPKNALQYLPVMRASDNCLLGRQTERIYHRIGVNYRNKPKRIAQNSDSDITTDQSGEEGDDEEDEPSSESSSEESSSSEEDSDETNELASSSDDDDDDTETSDGGDASGEDSESSGPLSPLRGKQNPDNRFNKLGIVLEKIVEEEQPVLLPKDEIAKNLCEYPKKFVPLNMAEYETDEITQDVGRETMVHGIPGFKAQPNVVSRSRGAENFFNYVGRWHEGKPTGDGLFVFVDGGKYVGDWDGFPHGHGTASYPDGSTYVGEWKNGKKHGKGTAVSVHGTLYEGSYEHGQRSGVGTLTLTNKSVYVGGFLAGKFHGRGKFTSILKWSYQGCWANGLVSGSGALFKPDGTRIVRYWKPPRTFGDLVRFMKHEEAEKTRKKILTRRQLRAALDDMHLQHYVKRVRQRIKDAELAEIQREREEMDRIRRERKEELKKAKEEMLAKANEEKEREEEEGEELDEETDVQQGKNKKKQDSDSDSDSESSDSD